MEFGPYGQMVPNQFGPQTSGSPQPVPLDKRNILGTICPGGPNWLGTICPEGPIVGDQMSGDQMCLGPNVSQPLNLENYNYIFFNFILCNFFKCGRYNVFKKNFKYFAPQNIKKLSSKVAHNPNRSPVFSPASFCFVKLRQFYSQTLQDEKIA